MEVRCRRIECPLNAVPPSHCILGLSDSQSLSTRISSSHWFLGGSDSPLDIVPPPTFFYPAAGLVLLLFPHADISFTTLKKDINEVHNSSYMTA